ncbi:hypothetical protein CDV36_001901 [Fusarium kuroshium]|uniref:3-hydroxyacyl-CoA dehydrogenase NAD binding domain-containing protein n=1 Tax=Fusarium kuroshium TaxID=2010991 RepID=A0A3M2SLE2_9HYPO|nr:hypothetical protein CDV36_001901 [Fusarium kuroshium]
MSWQPPKNFETRPVAILGAGVLGRRIACTWASAGYNVNVRDPSDEQRSQCLQYVDQELDSYLHRTSANKGTIRVFENLEHALEDAWLVIEAIPEIIELKIATFATLDTMAPQDCILCTNSSSYKSSEMISKVSEPTKRRILNMHYYMPPVCMVVELMTDGVTDEAIFPFLSTRLRETAASPYTARKESTGFIFNRLWAAIKREILTILSEGVSVPEEIDSIWRELFNGDSTPCKLMDDVGLDTVAFIESHYIAERGLSSKPTVDYLKTTYLDHGKLGSKSPNGGLYPPKIKAEVHNGTSSPSSTLLVLDVGLSKAEPSMTSGEILQLDTNGQHIRTVLSGQALPDGVDVDSSIGRIFWTNMGKPGARDGAVYSANKDGTGIRTLITPGAINTPKQLCCDTHNKKLYFSDREGCAVYRCNYDGSALETLVDNKKSSSEDGKQADVLDWCVGIAVSPSHGKFYWTQKGPSKGGKGRIFCAEINNPGNVSCIMDELPEPIDLEIDEAGSKLYWTDRGEIASGNALFMIPLDDTGLLAPVDTTSSIKPQLLTKNLNEAIGLKLDVKHNRIFVTDLGGRIYSYDIETGKKRVIYADDDRAFTGIVVL